MLADNPEMMRRVLQQAQGSSVTIDELTEAGRSQTQQGRSAIVPWIEKEAVGEPLGEWEGVLPRVKSADLPKKFRNVHLPMQFHERDYSVGALYDTLADDSEANRFLSEGAKALKSEEAFQKARKNHVFKTTSDFRDAIDRLADYSASRAAFTRRFRARMTVIAPVLGLDSGAFDARKYSGISFRKGAFSALAPHVQPHMLMKSADHKSIKTTVQHYMSDTIQQRAGNTALISRGFAEARPAWAQGVRTESVWAQDVESIDNDSWMRQAYGKM